MPIAIQLQGFRIVHWREPWRILNFPTNFLGFVCPICSIMFPFFHEFCSFDINFLFINIDAAGEACGTILSVQLYCLTGYHCCDKDLYTCCATGYICAGTSCISIAYVISYNVPTWYFYVSYGGDCSGKNLNPKIPFRPIPSIHFTWAG